MKILPASHGKTSRPRRHRFRGQGLVEFAIVLPVMLIVIFVIVELARVLHAWLAVENGARFGVRYAVTGEFNDLYCLGGCDEQAEEDAARIPSAKDAARAGSVAILRNESLLPGQPGYYKVTVCSNKDGVVYFPSDPNTSIPADCQPGEDPGGPGDRVSVTVDFDHPLIVPIISSWWPQLHLTAKREGIVEQFRVARVVGLPATIVLPSFTPTESPPPTSTPTVTNTLPPTNTPTITQTATITPTPDCSKIYFSSMWVSSDDVYARVFNDNMADAYLIKTYFEWPDVPSPAYVDWFEFRYRYWEGNDSSSPTTVDDTEVELSGNDDERWETDFDDAPPEGIYGYFYLQLTFDYPDWGICVISRSTYKPQPPTRTPTRTPTWGPSPTRTPTRTLTPSRTPTRTPTWGPSPTRTRTRTPTPTRTLGPSRTPTLTPTITETSESCGLDC